MEYVIIGAIVIMQIIVFVKVYNRIATLKNYFPKKSNLYIEAADFEHPGGNIKVDLVKAKGKTSSGFKEVLNSTNSYLFNNKGSAADFNILKDITERQVDTIINAINSTVSVPLFLGLAGTFFGIIYGLTFLDFASDTATQATQAAINSTPGGSVISSESIGLMIDGVIVAMVASACGLILTLINSAWSYKAALFRNEVDKNAYYDFLQSSLLPKLSKDVSDSLNSLKSNLDHFNNAFGDNLIHYKDSFQLLNDNLTKEKEFLEAVQQVGLKKLSSQIVKTFDQISDASNDFHHFQKYQAGLNKNISASLGILKEYNEVSEKFSGFNKNLELVSGHIIESSDFYQQFKDFLESHFSEVEARKNVFTGAMEQIDKVLTAKLKEISEKTLSQQDAMDDQWRSTVDQLNGDIANVFGVLTRYVEKESEALKNYIAAEEEGLRKAFGENREFFKDFKFVEQLFDKFTAHSEMTHTHYTNVEGGLEHIAKLLSDDHSLLMVNKNLVEIKMALEKLTQTMAHQKGVSYE
ncbi:hypothetical protein [Robertkochia sediminum]|uniref:hypothetical protein n=1 Tax=Robertkochia sediminum TaxID=2785326 RepID=UPI001933CF89|nr:hypothetical protein [Robertkochia sediminum]MBL7471383.1 hypothetical protein [Robertkochia sediminum]